MSNNNKIDLTELNRTESPTKKSGVKKRFPSKYKTNNFPNRDTQGKFASGRGGLRITKKWNLKRLLPIVMAIALVGGYLVFQSFGAPGTKVYDLKSYYPNTEQYAQQYLEGNNYITGKPDRSVLWFEPQDDYTFKMYNAAPQNEDRRCNYDVLSWWPDNTLRYSETYSDCGRGGANKIVYNQTSPIIFLPSYWDSSKPWQLSGSTGAKYYEKDSLGRFVLKCTGTTNYQAKIIGIENVTPTEPAIRWQTIQTTKWETGAVPGKCTKGYTTRWQEDYWLTDKMKKQGGDFAKGLRRTKGGNLDVSGDSWDVWYDGWYTLPSSVKR